MDSQFMDSDTHQTFWVVHPLELMKHQPDSSVDVNDIYMYNMCIYIYNIKHIFHSKKTGNNVGRAIINHPTL